MSAKDKRTVQRISIKNKRASFTYTLLDRYTAGILLKGTEIKAIRMSKVALQEAYCYLADGELWIKGMYIAAYTHGNIYNHIEDRERKLLLNRKEIGQLIRSQEKGMTIIPTRLFVNERGWAKLEIALAKGKKIHDKRQQIKEKEQTRALRNVHTRQDSGLY